MEHTKNAPSAETVSSLSDLVIRYDMSKMISEAKVEFEALESSRELLDQNAIGNFFNLDQSDNAGN